MQLAYPTQNFGASEGVDERTKECNVNFIDEYEVDSYIDNTEAFEDTFPFDKEPEYGGFYVNEGLLVMKDRTTEKKEISVGTKDALLVVEQNINQNFKSDQRFSKERRKKRKDDKIFCDHIYAKRDPAVVTCCNKN